MVNILLRRAGIFSLNLDGSTDEVRLHRLENSIERTGGGADASGGKNSQGASADVT